VSVLASTISNPHYKKARESVIGSIARSVIAVVLALVLALALIIGVEVMSSVLHPLPPGLDPGDPEVIKAHVVRYPPGVLLLAGLGWGLTTLLSAWLATRLGSGRHPAHGILVGSMLLVAAVANMLMLPYPVWFWVLNLVIFPASIYLGARLERAGR
jgi:hypothetical protein